MMCKSNILLMVKINLPPSCPVIHSPWGPWLTTSASLVTLICLIRFGYLRHVDGHRSYLIRFILVSPLILLQLTTPLLFSCEPSAMLPRCIFIFSQAWMGVQKLVGFALLNRGPLTSDRLHGYSPWQLVGVALLPIMPSGRSGNGRLQDKAGGGCFSLLARWLLKTLLLIAICRLLVVWPPHNRDVEPGLAFLRDLVTAGLSYTFLGFLLDYPGAIAVGILHLEIVPTFDQSWRSSSLRDFWTNRWNVATSSLLRSLLFEDGSKFTPKKRKSRSGSIVHEIKRGIGVLIVFFFSGLLHEAAFWLVRYDFNQTNLRWMSFCLSSGLGLIIERLIVKSTTLRLRLPLSIPLTTIILLGYGHTFSCSSEFEILIPMFAKASV